HHSRNARHAWVVAAAAILVAAVFAIPAMRYLRETPAPAPDLWNIQRNVVSKDFPNIMGAMAAANFGSRGDKNNFGPRLGLAWNIADNGKSTVRMAYGSKTQLRCSR